MVTTNLDTLTYDELKQREALCVEGIGMLQKSLKDQQERLQLIRARIEVVKANNDWKQKHGTKGKQ